MERDEARKRLLGLAKTPGALKIITNQCRPEQGCTPEGHTNHPYPPTHPNHFVIHDVVRIEQHPTRGGILIAFSQDDFCLGYPEDLLPRLLEASGQVVAPASAVRAPSPNKARRSLKDRLYNLFR